MSTVCCCLVWGIRRGGVGWALLSGPDGPVSPAPDLGAGMNDSLRVLYGRRMEGAAVWGSLIVLWSEMQKVTGLLFHFPPKGGSLMAKPDLVSWLKGTEDPFMWGSEDSERPAGSCCFHMCVVVVVVGGLISEHCKIHSEKCVISPGLTSDLGLHLCPSHNLAGLKDSKKIKLPSHHLSLLSVFWKHHHFPKLKQGDSHLCRNILRFPCITSMAKSICRAHFEDVMPLLCNCMICALSMFRGYLALFFVKDCCGSSFCHPES